MEEMKKEQIPQIGSRLRQHILKIPEAVFQASGIIINGRRIKSFVFTTDLAIIRNCDADAVFAVYPFTPQQAISDAIIRSSYIPVFCGVGGGTTKGIRTVSLAKDVESQGAMGVVLNAPISDLNLLAVSNAVDIPVIITVTHEGTDEEDSVDLGGRRIIKKKQPFAAWRCDLKYRLRKRDSECCTKNPLGVSECSAGCIRWENQRKHL